MCERSALMIRMDITLERDMTERKRKENQNRMLEEAVSKAEETSQAYITSDEGKIMIHFMAKTCIERISNHTFQNDNSLSQANKNGSYASIEEDSDSNLTQSSEDTANLEETLVRQKDKTFDELEKKYEPNIALLLADIKYQATTPTQLTDTELIQEIKLK